MADAAPDLPPRPAVQVGGFFAFSDGWRRLAT